MRMFPSADSRCTIREWLVAAGLLCCIAYSVKVSTNERNAFD